MYLRTMYIDRAEPRFITTYTDPFIVISMLIMVGLIILSVMLIRLRKSENISQYIDLAGKLVILERCFYLSRE
ncbi:hypothetical protein DRN87_04410 [Candidatus Geothermarchaeota archaeon]|nr:MAG: hypothetical protein DRN87_04410 [Candidatus Geothermarchaeota archaeon]